MKVYVQTDIEGVAGFVFFENRANTTPEGFAHAKRMRRLLTAEVNAAVTAAFDAGATEVLINDNHGSGYNIMFEDLDSRCEIIHGRNCSGPHWLPELEGSDAMVCVGMHAMGGTPKSLLPHSRWEVNEGEFFLSEGTMAAAIAGQYGIPTLFASGDNMITDEFREKIPQIDTAVVKKALSCFQARSVMPARACGMIYEGVSNALKRKGEIPPYVIEGPLKLNLIDSPGHVPPLQRMLLEPVSADNIEDAFFAVEDQMPWFKRNVDLPDGFRYP